MVKKFKKDPLGCGEELEVLRTKVRSEMKEIVTKGPVDGLVKFIKRLGHHAAKPVLLLQNGGAWMTIWIFKKELREQQKKGETQQIRDNASAMRMLGFTGGDPLMEMNKAMHPRLAQELHVDI